MAGLDYLVGVRFKAYGNLLGEIGKYSFALAGLEAASDLLKNRFVDLAAAGIGAFAELTKAAENYQKMLANLKGELQGTGLAHKAMAQALSTKGTNAFLSPGSGVARGALLGNLFGNLNPAANKQYNRTMEMMMYTHNMSQANATGFMQKFVGAGLGYAQTTGVSSKNQETSSIRTAQMVAANMWKFAALGNGAGGAYLNNIYSALRSPYAGTPGLSEKTLFGAVGLNTLLQSTHGYGSGATQRFLALMTGHGSRQTIQDLMLAGVHVGLQGNLGMAVGGHVYKFNRQQMLGFLKNPQMLTKAFLPLVEQGSKYTGWSLNQVEHNSAAKAYIATHAKAMLGNLGSGIFSLFMEGYLLNRFERNRYGGNTPFTEKDNSKLLKSLGVLHQSLDKLGDIIGKQSSPMITNVIGGLSGATRWFTSLVSHHPWIGPAMTTGSLVATGIGVSGIVRMLGGLLSKVPMLGWLGKGVGLLGSAGMLGTAAFGGWEIGKILDKAFPHITGGLGKGSVGFVMSIFDAMKAFLSWVSGNGKGVAHDLHSIGSAFSFMTKGLNEMLKPFGVAPFLHSSLTSAEHLSMRRTWLNKFGSVHINSFGKYDVSTGELPVTYTETEKGKSTTSRLDVYLHGDEGTKSIAAAIARHIANVNTAEGMKLSRSHTIGVGG